MKRLTIFLFLVILLGLTSCSVTLEQETHVHNYSEWIEEVSSTCSQEGTLGHYKCTECGKYFDNNKIEIDNISIGKKEHNWNDGVLEDGVIVYTCTVCGEVESVKEPIEVPTVPPTEIPTVPPTELPTLTPPVEHVHEFNEWIAEVPATCTTEGILGHYECSCGSYFDKNKKEIKDLTIKEKGHSAGEDATCTTDQTCTVCGVVLTTAFGHTEVSDLAVAPTCTTTGLTEGKHCSVCDSILIAQNVVPTLEHEYSSECQYDKIYHWHNCILCGESGELIEHNFIQDSTNQKVCDGCGVVYSELMYSKGLLYELSEDGSSYSVIGIGTCEDMDLSIPEIYNGLPVITIGEAAFENCTQLLSVEVPNSITTIGKGAFYGCTSLTKMTLPFIGKNEVRQKYFGFIFGAADYTKYNYIPRSLKEVIITGSASIGIYAFYECSYIESIIVSSDVTSIELGAFYGCGSLKSITLPFVGSSAIGLENNHFSYVFGSGSFGNTNVPTSLQEVTISGTTSVVDYSFYNCGKISKIEFLGNVTYIGTSAFDNCYSLKKVTFDENSEFTSIGKYAFNKCNALTNLEIPNSVSSIGAYAFNKCSNLINIILPNGLKSIGDHTFSECVDLTSVEISDGLESIGSYAFSKCSSLTNIEIPDSVTNIGEYAFNECSSLTSVEMPSGLSVICNYTFNQCNNLTTLTIPESLTSIGNSAFYYCYSLTSVEMPSSLTTIGSYAFYYCISLESLEIPGSVTNIGYGAFINCSGFTSIIVDANNSVYDSRENCNAIIETSSNKLILGSKNTVIPSDVMGIGDYAFSNCGGLTSVEIPNGVTFIGAYAFDGCKGLPSLVIPNSVTSIGEHAFANCIGLSSIDIPSSVTSYSKGILYGCWGLSKITIPYLNSYLGYIFGTNSYENHPSYVGYIPKNLKEVVITGGTKISNVAFCNCDNLTKIVIPNTVTSIGQGAFVGCDNLVSLTLPFVGASLDGTTNTHFGYIFDCSYTSSYQYNGKYVLKTLKEVIITGGTVVDDYAFYDCEYIESITIPASVTSIGKYAFQDCTRLKNTYYDGTVESWCIIELTNAYSNPMSCASYFYILDSDGIVMSNDKPYSLLSEIKIPETIETIGSYIFYGFNCLDKIEIPSSVTSISDNAFYYCYLTDIKVDADNSVFDSRDNCNAIIETSSNKLILGSKNTSIPNSVTSIGECAFIYSTITSIQIPTNVTSIGDRAFACCTQLEVISFEKDSQLTSIGDRAFSRCSSLTKVEIPTSVISIGEYAFDSCNGLKNIEIPSSVTSIGFAVFNKCNNIETITIPVVNKFLGYMFGAAEYKENASFVPSGLTEIIISGGTSISSYAFYGCEYLTNVKIPDSVTSINSYAFYKCNRLTNVSFDENSQLTSIGNNAFAYCYELKFIILPNSLTTLNEDVFFECYNLKDIIMPISLKKIGVRVFSGISQVHRNYYYFGTAEDWANISISQYSSMYGTIYYYSETYPTDDGNYWYFDVDGVTPLVWE